LVRFASHLDVMGDWQNNAWGNLLRWCSSGLT
jgi:hypothetical protein